MGKKPPTTFPIASSPGASCPGGRLKPGPPPRKSSIPVMRDPINAGRDETRDWNGNINHSVDMLPDDDAAHDAGYEADVEIVRPYAIEEPDEETDRTPTSAATPNLLEATEQWQKELVNSLRGLYCDSDSTDTPPLVRHKRGRKRKPDTSVTASQGFQNVQPSKDRDVDMGVGNTVLSPKRRRRKSTKTGDDLKNSHSCLLASNNTTTTSSPVLTTSSRDDGKQSSPLRRDFLSTDRMDID